MIKFCRTYKEGTNKGIINVIRVREEKKKYFIEEIMVELKHKVTNTHMGKGILSNVAKEQIYIYLYTHTPIYWVKHRDIFF